eukprot:366387-Chlamydomonas_euryale.AAC.13
MSGPEMREIMSEPEMREIGTEGEGETPERERETFTRSVTLGLSPMAFTLQGRERLLNYCTAAMCRRRGGAQTEKVVVWEAGRGCEDVEMWRCGGRGCGMWRRCRRCGECGYGMWRRGGGVGGVGCGVWWWWVRQGDDCAGGRWQQARKMQLETEFWMGKKDSDKLSELAWQPTSVLTRHMSTDGAATAAAAATDAADGSGAPATAAADSFAVDLVPALVRCFFFGGCAGSPPAARAPPPSASTPSALMPTPGSPIITSWVGHHAASWQRGAVRGWLRYACRTYVWMCGDVSEAGRRVGSGVR